MLTGNVLSSNILARANSTLYPHWAVWKAGASVAFWEYWPKIGAVAVYKVNRNHSPDLTASVLCSERTGSDKNREMPFVVLPITSGVI